MICIVDDERSSVTTNCTQQPACTKPDPVVTLDVQPSPPRGGAFYWILTAALVAVGIAAQYRRRMVGMRPGLEPAVRTARVHSGSIEQTLLLRVRRPPNTAL